MITGIGTVAYDKRLGYQFCTSFVTPDEGREIWRGDDLGARLVDKLPEETFRRGWKVTTADEEDDEKLKELHKLAEKLSVNAKLKKAAKFERALGGAAIMIGALDSKDVMEPLTDDGAIREIAFLTVFEIDDLTPWSYYTDPREAGYGEVEIWTINPITVALGPGNNAPEIMRVHETRVLHFQGIRTSRRNRDGQRPGFGDNVFTRVADLLRDFHASFNAAGILVQDFAQAVIKIQGLAEAFAEEEEGVESMRNRIKAVELARSVARAVILDSTEEYERKATPVAGLPDLIDRFMIRLAAAFDTPFTELFGDSPSGMAATGAGETRSWYAQVDTWREDKIDRHLERLIKLMFRTLGGEPDDWTLDWVPLWQPTDKEDAETRKTIAETDKILIESSVIAPEEAAIAHYSQSKFNPHITIDFEARETIEDEFGLPDAEPTPMEEAELAVARQMSTQPAPGATPPPGTPPPPPPGVSR